MWGASAKLAANLREAPQNKKHFDNKNATRRYYSKTSLIRTPLNQNSAKPNKPVLQTSFYLNRMNFG